jgi:hypothetical protein
VATIVLPPGGNITCTYTNQKVANMPVFKFVGNTLVTCAGGPFPTPFTAPCTDPVMGNLTPGGVGIFTLRLYAGAIADVQPPGFPLVVPFPPHFDPQVNAGDSFTLCETVPTGWKIPVTDDVVLTALPVPLGDPTPTLFAHPSIARTSCWSFTIPANTSSFEIDIHNTPLSKIIVDKVTLPAGSVALFDFTPTGYGAPFQLADATAPNDSGFIAGGNYTVAEAAKLHWDLTNLGCIKSIPAGGGGTSTFTFTGGNADPAFQAGDNTANIGLQAGATVTCTYTNTQHGHIIIVKNTVNGCGVFPYSGTGNAALVAGFNLDTCPVDATPNSASTDFEVLPGGPFTVTEGTLPTSLFGTWEFTSLSCTAGGAQVGTSTTANITVAPGATVTCTYTNTLVAPLQACSPGYWKQPQHFGSYTGTGIDPFATTYGSIFSAAPAELAGLTFPEVISLGGGGIFVLGRQSAAAYLDAAAPGIPGYPYSTGQVVTWTNAAFVDLANGAPNPAYDFALSQFAIPLQDENCPLGRATLPGFDGPGIGHN